MGTITRYLASTPKIFKVVGFLLIDGLINKPIDKNNLTLLNTNEKLTIKDLVKCLSPYEQLNRYIQKKPKHYSVVGIGIHHVGNRKRPFTMQISSGNTSIDFLKFLNVDPKKGYHLC